MAYTTASANAMLKLILQAIAIAGLADPAASGGLTQLWLSLHAGQPAAVADQTSNEISYTGYGRVSVPRSNLGWTVTGADAALVNAVQFLPMSGGAGGTVTHIGLGTAQSGAGLLLVHGPISPVIPVQLGFVPRLSPATKVQFKVV